MAQHGQVLRLRTTRADGKAVWAYRYRVNGRCSKRPQVGGFATRAEAQRALRRTLERQRSSHPPAGGSPVPVSARAPGSRLAASGGNARRRSSASKSLRGASERPVRSIKRILPPRELKPARDKGEPSRGIDGEGHGRRGDPGVQRSRTPRGRGIGTVARWVRELEKPSPAPGSARSAWEAMGAYKRLPREVACRPGGWRRGS